MINKDPNSNIEPELKDILDELEEAMTPESGGYIETSDEVNPVRNSKPLKKEEEPVDNELTKMLDQLEEENKKEAGDKKEVNETEEIKEAEIVEVGPKTAKEIKAESKAIAAQREFAQEIAIPDDDEDRLKRLISKALVVGSDILDHLEDDRKEVDRCLRMLFDKALDDNRSAIEQLSALLSTKAQINGCAAKIMDNFVKMMSAQKKNIKATQNNNITLTGEELNKLLGDDK